MSSEKVIKRNVMYIAGDISYLGYLILILKNNRRSMIMLVINEIVATSNKCYRTSRENNVYRATPCNTPHLSGIGLFEKDGQKISLKDDEWEALWI